MARAFHFQPRGQVQVTTLCQPIFPGCLYKVRPSSPPCVIKNWFINSQTRSKVSHSPEFGHLPECGSIRNPSPIMSCCWNFQMNKGFAHKSNIKPASKTMSPPFYPIVHHAMKDRSLPAIRVQSYLVWLCPCKMFLSEVMCLKLIKQASPSCFHNFGSMLRIHIFQLFPLLRAYILSSGFIWFHTILNM